MNTTLYEKFREYEKIGLKKQSKESLRAFIRSFEDEEQIENWVWKYLPGLESKRHLIIRHEIFHELVYPVLKRGYLNDEPKSTLWLGKLSQNIYKARQLHQELHWVSELSLYKKCHESDPSNDEARLLVLEAIVDWLAHSAHEWPSGILYGMDGATIEQCDEIEIEVQQALQLDKEQQYTEFIEQYAKKLSEYRSRFSRP